MPIYRVGASTYLVQHFGTEDSPTVANTAGAIFTNRFDHLWMPGTQVIVPGGPELVERSKSGVAMRRTENTAVFSNYDGGVRPDLAPAQLAAAFTFAVIYRAHAPASVLTIANLTTSSFGNRFRIDQSASMIPELTINSQPVRSAVGVSLSGEEWGLLLVTKAAGTVIARAHRYNFRTGVWVHGDFSNTNNDVSGHSNGYWFMGSNLLANYAIDYAAMAVWASDSNDATCEALVSSGVVDLKAWLATSPTNLLQFNQEDALADVEDIVGGRDFYANSNGASGFDFDGPPGLLYAEAKEGTASVSGGGQVTSTGNPVLKAGTASVSGGGQVVATGRERSASLTTTTGGGTVTSTGQKKAQGTASVSGGGTEASTGQKKGQGTAVIGGGGTCLCSGLAASPKGSATSCAGGGTVTATGQKNAKGTSTTSGGGAVACTRTKGGRGASASSGGGSVTSTGRKQGRGTVACTGGGQVVCSGTERSTQISGVVGGGLVSSSGRKAARGSCTLSGGGQVICSGTAFEAKSGTSAVGGGGNVHCTGIDGVRSDDFLEGYQAGLNQAPSEGQIWPRPTRNVYG